MTNSLRTGPRIQVPPNCDLTLGMVCVDKSVPGTTVWRAGADERFCNPAGIVQGGFLAAMCDSAMGASAVTYAQDRKVFARNAEMKVSFLAPVAPARVLECVATVISGGRSAAFVEAELADIGPVESGPGGTDPGAREPRRLVAKASSTYLYAERQGGPEAGRGPG
jgi:acyl-coenzyme A thioesterase PaaI-like protein